MIDCNKTTPTFLKDQPNAFLGRGWAFPPVFKKVDKNGKRVGETQMVDAETDIRQSLHILFHTSLGERIMQPGYGCNLHDLVFSPMDTTTATLFKSALETAIRLHEPRIIIDNLIVHYYPENPDTLLIELDYTVRATNARANMVFPFYLNGELTAPVL
ncbi:hypothetical protein C7N43_25995 [Sphingobacteriales bacterium UPWRP_1]|nr:hypothetical protein BVG80_17800 [Sphingobacteriales bacterium TSM_CSM]PSJ74048.1 hypothetical protein C7N43_25995 [Sphingobacteriales bacterium UPWRP_1]